MLYCACRPDCDQTCTVSPLAQTRMFPSKGKICRCEGNHRNPRQNICSHSHVLYKSEGLLNAGEGSSSVLANIEIALKFIKSLLCWKDHWGQSKWSENAKKMSIFYFFHTRLNRCPNIGLLYRGTSQLRPPMGLAEMVLLSKWSQFWITTFSRSTFSVPTWVNFNT